MGDAIIILVEIALWGLVLLLIGAGIEWVFSKIRRRRMDNQFE